MNSLALNSITEVLNYLKDKKMIEVAEAVEKARKRQENSHFLNRTGAVKDASTTLVHLKNEKRKLERMICSIIDPVFCEEVKRNLAPVIKYLYDDPICDLRNAKIRHSHPRKNEQ